MTEAHLFCVFTDAAGSYGDAASVVIDEGRQIADSERQAMARTLSTGETVFINSVEKADISIVHPQGEIGFAGVVALATSWLLTSLRSMPTNQMQARDGAIVTWQDKGLTWARASLDVMPPWNYKQFDSPAAVEALAVDEMKDVEHVMTWAWIDEAKGLIRARTFANDWDIPEAQGNGAGRKPAAWYRDQAR